MSEIKREIIKLYNGKVEIEFLQGSHTYYLLKDGKKLPKKKRLAGATTFTGQIDKSSPLLIWATRLYTARVKELMREDKSFTADDILSMLALGESAHKEKKEQAANIGDYVHKFAEEYSKDQNQKKAYDRMKEELGDIPTDMLVQVQTSCVALLDWLKKEKVKILSSEKIVYSRKVGFVGTYDAIVEIDKKKYLLDWKTAKGVYSSHIYQSSAYFNAHEEENSKDKLDGVMIVSIAKEDIFDRDKNLIRKAGTVISVKRTRADVLKDYVAFKSLVVLRSREQEVSKQLTRPLEAIENLI